jgi:zinc transporter ZupT
VWLTLTLSVLAASADVLGGILAWWAPKLRDAAWLTALGTGFLLGATLLDRMPDAMHELPKSAPVWIGTGYLLLLLLEQARHALPHAHGHVCMPGSETAAHEAEGVRRNAPAVAPEGAWAAFLGLVLHTFMDGVIIAGAFTVSRATGILMFVAITLHKLPEGFGMATITLAAGGPRRRALWTAAGLGVSTLLGALVTLRLGRVDIAAVHVLMAIATGTFLYITATDLVPAVKRAGRMPAFAVAAGFVLFGLSLYLIQAVGLG